LVAGILLGYLVSVFIDVFQSDSTGEIRN